MRTSVLYNAGDGWGVSAWTCLDDVALFKRRCCGVPWRLVAPSSGARWPLTGADDRSR